MYISVNYRIYFSRNHFVEHCMCCRGLVLTHLVNSEVYSGDFSPWLVVALGVLYSFVFVPQN